MGFNFGGVTEQSMEEGGTRVLPGRYHAIVQDVDDSHQKQTKEGHDQTVIKFEILAGTVPSEVTKVHTERLIESDKAMARIAAFCLATELCTVADLGNPNVDVKLPAAVGRQLVIEIEDNSYKDNDGKMRTNSRVTWAGFHQLYGAKAEGVPLNPDYAALQPNPNGNGDAAGGPVAAPKNPPTKPAGGGSKYNI